VGAMMVCYIDAAAFGFGGLKIFFNDVICKTGTEIFSFNPLSHIAKKRPGVETGPSIMVG